MRVMSKNGAGKGHVQVKFYLTHLMILSLCVAMMLASIGPASAQVYSVLRNFGIRANITGWGPLAPLTQGPDGTLYGTCSVGESIDLYGSIFKVNPDGTGFYVLKLCTNSAELQGLYAPVTVVGNTLYGTSLGGGSNGSGTIFEINTDGTGFTILRNMAAGDGTNPRAGLVGAGNVLYGTASTGGASGLGSLFAINTDGSGFTNLHSFSANDGSSPFAKLSIGGDTLFGTCENGGSNGYGTVFSMKTNGMNFTVLKTFSNSDGATVRNGVLLSGNILYGVTYGGGTANSGTIFAMSTNGSNFSVLRNLTSGDGANPLADLAISGNTLYGTAHSGGAYGLGTLFAININGLGFTNLHSFGINTEEAYYPSAGVIVVSNALYGTAYYGGTSDFGTVFKINFDGTGYTNVNGLAVSDATTPMQAFILSGSTLFGVSYAGGMGNGLVAGLPGYGTVYRIETNGSGYSNLYSFDGSISNGGVPIGPLAISGNTLYGSSSTIAGAAIPRGGAIFKINTDGSGYAALKSFTNSVEGSSPAGALALSGNSLYGTTAYGGPVGYGNIFKMDLDGSNFTVLFNFTGTNGEYPYGGILLANGNLYGTTYYGGSSSGGTVFKIGADGSNFMVLKNFPSGSQTGPNANVILVGGTLYGTTQGGGSNSAGTIYKVNTDGTGFATIANFGSTNGTTPKSGLTYWNGALYGTTRTGGTSGFGVIYKVNTDGTKFTVLKNFTGVDGKTPQCELVFSGNVAYGSASAGGYFSEGNIFSLDLTPIPLAFASNNLGFNLTNHQFNFSISGPPGSNVIIFGTTNFHTWVPLATNALGTGALSFTDFTSTNYAERFYRAELLP